MVLIPHLEIPVDPDAPEARRWVVEELSKPEYASAEPTPFDLAMQAIRDWIASLFEGAAGVPGPLLALLAVLVLAVLLVVALLVYGLPRLRRRRGAVAPLFDDHDLRDLPTLRRAADAAAASEDWALAIEERYRAIVRGVVDRDLVRVHPGTTAHGFADAASRPLPTHAEALRAAAVDFDAVRYLGRAGSRERYEAIVRLDLAVEATVPEHAETAVAPA